MTNLLSTKASNSSVADGMDLKQNLISNSNKLSTNLINHTHNLINTNLNTKIIDIDDYKTVLIDNIIPSIQGNIQNLVNTKQHNIVKI